MILPQGLILKVQTSYSRSLILVNVNLSLLWGWLATVGSRVMTVTELGGKGLSVRDGFLNDFV